MKSRWLLKLFAVLGLVVLGGGWFIAVQRVKAATLDSLAMGSVIQIQGKDTYMCNDTSTCASTTTTVLPYKLVKMQARDQAGNEVTRADGTYWTLLDNYCWWGSANCNSLGTKSSFYTTWNGNSASDWNNNLSSPQTYNILQQLSNFYNSLPDSIAGVSKATALLDHAYDMFSIIDTSGNGTTTTGACPTGWTAANRTINSNSYFFSDSSSCTMTSKIGLPSYTEWQGGLYARGYHPNTAGSSATYCNARFGVSDCTNNGTYYLFYSADTQSGFPVHSASNPRPYYPWLRTANAGSSYRSWYVYGRNSSYSANYGHTYGTEGVVPSLWISSSICTTDSGSGTYDSPYSLTACNNTPSLTLNGSANNITLNSQGAFTLNGIITDLDEGQTIIVKSSINGIEKSMTFTSPINEAQYYLSWTAQELGDGFTGSGATVTATDDQGASSSQTYIGTLTVNSSVSTYLTNLPLGSTIQINGQQGAQYKFIKMNATNGDDSYWMLADNYCELPGAPTQCVMDTSGTILGQTQVWDPTSQNNNPDWAKVSQTPYSVYQQVLQPLYSDLPNVIGQLGKNQALPVKSWDMSVINATTQSSTTRAGCKISSHSQADLSTCTWSDRVSLPTYTDWQAGLHGYEYYSPGNTPANQFFLTRFNQTWPGLPHYNFWPWLSTPSKESSNYVVWAIYGYDTFSVGSDFPNTDHPISPVLYLDKSLTTIQNTGTGTYADPFYLNYCDIPAHQNEFACLPMGSVIQIQSTDTQMCNDANCSTYTDQVLPYKFIKMQARDQAGTAVSMTNASYWMMLDNYCWWGSANCSSLENKFSYMTTWNANSTGLGNYDNNLSSPRTYNILTQLSNFYNSLPDSIAGISKSTALLDHAYDMFSITNTSGTGSTTAGACPTGWTANNQIINSNPYTFSDSSSCTMTAKIGLPSYTEWQSGLYARSYYSTTMGSSASYCKARFGVADCTNNGTYGLFNANSISSGQPLQSAVNPRPHYPWLRSAYVGSNTLAWNVGGDNSSYSMSNEYTVYGRGVSPSLWLSSELNPPVCGSGTYDDPYKLSEYDCDTAPVMVLDNPTENHFVDISDDGQGSNQVTFTGSVSDPDNGQEISIKAEFYDDNGNLLFAKNVPFTNDGSFSKTSPLNAEPFSLALTYTELINYGVDSYTNVKFFVSDTIKTTTTLYTSTISLTPLNDLISNLTESLTLRFSGQIYYPDSVATTNMTSPGDTYDNYTLLTTIDSNHQIWTKELLAHPDAMATSSSTATPSTQIYPFLVRFYEEPSKMGKIELN